MFRLLFSLHLRMAQTANKNGDVRVTVITQESVMNDVKFIAAWERKQLKELTTEIFSDFVTEWKIKNKGVKFPPKN